MPEIPKLRRIRHESDDQYADRYQIYCGMIPTDTSDKAAYDAGVDRAEVLSMIYSNIKYMHCRYESSIEDQLKHIPCTLYLKCRTMYHNLRLIFYHAFVFFYL
jgi:hypothetical protein